METDATSDGVVNPIGQPKDGSADSGAQTDAAVDAKPDASPIGPLLTITEVVGEPQTQTPLNLTLSGERDWVQWGRVVVASYERKAGVVSPAISTYTKIIGGSASALFGRYMDNPATFSWVDGTPTLTEPGTRAGVFFNGVMNGFQLQVLAGDTNEHELVMHAEGSNGKAKLSLQLGTASAMDETFDSTAIYFPRYTIRLRAPSSTEPLVIRWVHVSGGETGDVGLSAITLK